MQFIGNVSIALEGSPRSGVGGYASGGHDGDTHRVQGAEFATVPYQRAALVVRCAIEVLGLTEIPDTPELHLDLNVQQFCDELIRRFGTVHPTLVYRTDSSIERARLTRPPGWNLPKVVLRQGAPRRQPPTRQGGPAT